jgi:predicted PurR-regulated permease PerM
MELNSKNIKKILLVVFLSAVIVACVFNSEGVFLFLGKIFTYISPIIIALCIAFILNVPLNALENRIFKFMAKSKRKFIQKMRRPLCMILTYLLAFGIISVLVLVIIPDIIETVIYIVDKLPSFVVSSREWLIKTFTRFGFAAEDLPLLNLDLSSFTNTVKNLLSSYSGKIVGDAVTITTSVIGGVFDTVFSLVISAYVLAQKERIGRFVKKLINTFTSTKFASTVYHIANQAAESFSRFIGGQLTESVILGVLCYIGMLIFRFPNAPIISVLICVTSLVPVVGALVGVFIGALLILITNPVKALLFVIFIIILQQIEGNLIYPRVVGKAVGLPGIIVISAVLVGGNIGGIIGALIAVPVSATLFILLKEAIEKQHKN